ncbi:MAG: Ig-like domain-containing protein [bacterium]
MKIKNNRMYVLFIILAVISFFLSGCGGSEYGTDNQPFIRITSPIDGSTVSGIVPIFAEAPDNENISKVILYIDGYPIIGSEDYYEPYEFEWNTTSYQNWSVHTLIARAFDFDDKIIDSDAIILTVNNTT